VELRCQVLEDIDLDTLKVPELKEWLGAKGIETSERKADLVEKVDTYWENK
jgi:hypothetical protein